MYTGAWNADTRQSHFVALDCNAKTQGENKKSDVLKQTTMQVRFYCSWTDSTGLAYRQIPPGFYGSGHVRGPVI